MGGKGRILGGQMFLPTRRAPDIVRFRHPPQKFFEFVSTIVARVFEYRHNFRVARTAVE
jgi:hypothetical protein